MSLIRNGKLCSENNGLSQSHGCCVDCCWRCCHSVSLIQFSDALMCFDYFLMPAISHSIRWWAFLGLRTEELLIFNCIFFRRVRLSHWSQGPEHSNSTRPSFESVQILPNAFSSSFPSPPHASELVPSNWESNGIQPTPTPPKQTQAHIILTRIQHQHILLFIHELSNISVKENWHCTSNSHFVLRMVIRIPYAATQRTRTALGTWKNVALFLEWFRSEFWILRIQ